jgi:tripartite-type tricarboxylate transporter receptor subunit TctC
MQFGGEMKKIGMLLGSIFLWSIEASAQTPYFQGKTIRVVVGYPAGSAHDLWARLIAPQLTKHIPGNPATVVQNMPGAGAMTATNYIYSVAKPDGLTLGVNNAALYFEQLLKKKEAQYDWAKFTWVGSTTPTNPLLYMWANTPYKTIQDVRTATVPPKCGATGTGNTGYYLPRLLEETIGAKFQIVTGYEGGASIELAVERGEVQCRAFTVQVFFGREPFNTWRSKNLVRVLIQGGKKRDPRLPETPLLSELMDQYKVSDLHRRLVTVMMGSGEFGAAPMFASPGTPPELTKILRAGYAKALTSPELIADAKKQGLEPDLIHGDEIEALAKEVLNQPAEVIAAMKKVMGE